MPSRRVPKGPDRQPMSQKRRQFLKLLAEGWSMRAACLELGIGRSTGHIWKNGTVLRSKDGTVQVCATARTNRRPHHLADRRRLVEARLEACARIEAARFLL